MTDYTVSIPESLYDRAKRVAEQADQPVEQVILARLEESLEPLIDLPVEERTELHALAYLSDDTLWTIAREQMPNARQERMQALMDKNSLGTISDDEYQELGRLVEQGERLTLRKAEAMKLLMDRGYSVTLDNLEPADE
jgi:hypothetical protein